MVRDRAGRTACHRLLERPQAPLCLGSQTAPSHPTSSRYRSNAESRIDLADAPLRIKSNDFPVGAVLIESGVIPTRLAQTGERGASQSLEGPATVAAAVARQT